MADIYLHLRVGICFLIIFYVQDSRANMGMSDLLGILARDLYNKLPLGAANNDDIIIQERPSNEMSLMQEIKSGRHGRGGYVHIYGLHSGGERSSARDLEPRNIIDV